MIRNRPRSGRAGVQPQSPQSDKRVTLSRALSKLGFCSRSQAEALIAERRVHVDGRVAADPGLWVDLDRAKIAVDGNAIRAEPLHYLMLNKPRGLVTTRADPEGRPTVYDCLIGFDIQHLSPVGRLDKASEGLLLFTNDTKLAQALLDPITHVKKTYHVQAGRLLDEKDLHRLEQGVEDKGERLSAKTVRLLRSGGRTCWLEIDLVEGKNRQIRRMLESLDVECLRLVRIAFGTVTLGALGKGQARRLEPQEISELRRAVGLEPSGRIRR